MPITQQNSFGRPLPGSTIPNSPNLSGNLSLSGSSANQTRPRPVGFNYEYVSNPGSVLSESLRTLYDDYTGIHNACPSFASRLEGHKLDYDRETGCLSQALSLKLTDKERDLAFLTLETNRRNVLCETVRTLDAGIADRETMSSLNAAQSSALIGARAKLGILAMENKDPDDARSIAKMIDAFNSDLSQKDSTIWRKDLGIIPPIIPTSINYSVQATKNGIEHSINAARWGKSCYDSARSTLGGWCETAAETAGSVLDTAASVVGGATSVVTGTASVLGGVASSTGGLLASGVAGGYRSTANALDWLRSATVGDSKSAATTGYTGPSPLARALLNQYSNPQSQRTGGFGVASYSSPLLMA